MDAGPAGLDAEALLARFRAEGVLLSFATAPGVLRAVTHLDVSAEDVEQAIPALVRAFDGSGAPAARSGRGAERPTSYSYWSARSTFSFAARRAGAIAARMPTMIATIGEDDELTPTERRPSRRTG